MSALAGQPGVYVSEAGNGFPANTWAWFRGWVELTADATATNRYMHAVNLTAAAGSVTITLPATFPASDEPYYFGFLNDSTVTNGSKVVIIKTAAAVEVARLSAAGESVWLGRNPSTGGFVQLAHANPSAYQWTWADAATRNAASVSALQIGTVGYQTDMELQFQLVSQAAGVGTWQALWDARFSRIGRGFMGNPNTATPINLGTTLVTTAGALAAKVAASTNRATAQPRSSLNTAASLAATALYRAGGASNVNYALQGYRATWTGVLDAVSASMRWSFGFGPVASANADPSSLTNTFYLAADAADAHAQVMYNDAAGTATKVDLGASFPARTQDVGYRLDLYAPVGGADLRWMVTRLDVFAQVSGIASANLIANTTSQTWSWYLSNNLESTLVSLGMVENLEYYLL